MLQNQERPIAFFDLETTGISTTKDRIIEISIIKINLNGDQEKYYSRVNPQMPISQESFEAHKISNDDLESEPKWEDIANDVLNFIEGCDLAGYNINKFDVPLLLEEFLRADIVFNYKNISILDVYRIYTKMEPRTLSGTYYSFTGKNMSNAHQAESDNLATMEILQAMINKYGDDLPKDTKSIEKLTIENEFNVDFDGKFIFDITDEGTIVKFNFGKYKDKTIQEVFNEDSGYFNWMINKADFSSQTKVITKKILEKLNNTPIHK